MHRYEVGAKLGDGTYGEVLRATNKTSGEVVAIKRFALSSSCLGFLVVARSHLIAISPLVGPLIHIDVYEIIHIER